MDLELEYVLKRIKGKVACLIDGERKEFSSGDEAYEVYGNREPGKEYYVVDVIYAEKDTVVLAATDIRPEIDKQTKEFEEEHYRQFGVYPNRFDGA